MKLIVDTDKFFTTSCSMNEKQLICKKCGKPREIGRKLCRKCNLERLKIVAKKRHIEGRRTMYTKHCEACGNTYQAWSQIQKFCSSCYAERKRLAKESISTNKYVYIKAANRQVNENKWEHRRLAESVLKRKLTCHEIVHHINDNPKDNRLENLMMMDRRLHGKLHNYLKDQRVILEKSGNENLGNCWDNLIVSMTTAWLKTTGAKVLKLSEIGQSAAEPLMELNSYEEGSETCAPSIQTDNAVDEDTVQTTTLAG